MTDRANVYAIHSWEDPESCRRFEQLLRESDPSLAHYSVTPERALPGTERQVRESIRSRIGFATAVLVVNTPGIHLRSTATFEMEVAVAMKKRIVVVQPYGEFYLPIPEVLHGNVYRHATWRSDVVGRAVRGEYSQDNRVLDIAEVADRRQAVGVLSAAVGFVSCLIIVHTAIAFKSLQDELAASGVDLRWDGAATSTIVAHAIAGVVIGGLLGALSGDRDTVLLCAAAGATVGTAIGVRRVYTARRVSAEDAGLILIEST